MADSPVADSALPDAGPLDTGALADGGADLDSTSTDSGAGAESGSQYGGYVIFGVTTVGATTTYLGQAAFYAGALTSASTCPGGTQQAGCCYRSAAAVAAGGMGAPPLDAGAGTLTLRGGSATLASLAFNGLHASSLPRCG